MPSPRSVANTDDIWSALEALLARADADAIRAHGLGPLAALRWQEKGDEVPTEFAREARLANITNVVASAVARRIHAAYDGPLLLFKGPEVAARYPRRARLYRDIDLLAADAPATRRSLVAAGFREVQDSTGFYSDIHHLPPVQLPELPLPIEIHTAPKWPADLKPPPLEEIFRDAVASAVGGGALLAPAPHHHSLLLAAHAWAHTPLEMVRDLIDVAAIAEEADPEAIQATADAWGLTRLWRTTQEAIDWLFHDGRRPLATRIWARHMSDLREARVIEQHLEYWLSSFWLLPPREAAGRSVSLIRRDLSRVDGESRSTKLARVVRVASRAFWLKSRYDALEGRQPDRRQLAQR